MAANLASSDDAATFRKKLALALMQEGGSTAPVQHWTQGLARMTGGVMGGMELRREEQKDETEKAAAREMMASLLGQTGQQPQAAPQAAPATEPQPAADPSLPRGMRNNNPLNIEAGSFTQGQPGFAGSDGRFAKFASLDDGKNAAGNLLNVYNTKHGLNTVEGIVGRWAPSADGNNVSAYAGNVSKALGVAPNAPIDVNDPQIKEKLIAAMAQHENGRPLPQSAAPAAPQQPMQVAQAGGPNREMLVRMLSNKHTAPMALAVIQSQLSQSMKPETTDEIKEYNLYSSQEKAGGRQPKTFFDFKADLKRAGAIQNTVQIDQKTEGEFDKKAAGLQAERFDTIVKGGAEAQGMVADIGALRELSGNITTGKTAEIAAALGPYAEALGVKIDGLNDMQAYKAIVARMAPRMRVAGSGATSDFEMRQFLESLPGLGKTPGGNEIIANTLDATAQHKIAAAEIASKALNKEITRTEAEKLLRELPDPLTLWKKQGKELLKASPAAASPAQVNIDDLLKKYGGKK